MKTYTIKPLEWWKADDGTHYAITPSFRLFVGFCDGALRWGFCDGGDTPVEYQQCGSVEQGKAAAEAAWIEYVEQMLKEIDILSSSRN